MPTAQLSSEDPALPQGPSSPWFLQAAVVAAWSMGRKTHKHQSKDQKWPQEAPLAAGSLTCRARS